jgi:predicted Zn-dependent peptidase
MVQKYVVSELDSGERVISERVPSVRSVALGFWIGAGSRDETDGKAGVSHFIEHLLFKGSARYTAQEIAEIFDGLGGELNAATSREHTMVYARVPDDHVQTALNVMTRPRSPTSTRSARSCSRRSRCTRTRRRSSSTTSSPRPSSAATRSDGR